MINQKVSLFFSGKNEFFIRQVKEWGEILIGFESRNKYKIFDSNKNLIGYCSEQGNGIKTAIKRWFLRSHRPLEVFVFNDKSEVILILRRPFYWLTSTMTVFDCDNKYLGVVEQKFAFLKKLYELKESNGQHFASINSGFFSFFKFEIRCSSGTSIGLITKKWGKVLKELFTDADSFGLKLKEDLILEHKVIVFANAISIDFDFFEDNANKRGIF